MSGRRIVVRGRCRRRAGRRGGGAVRSTPPPAATARRRCAWTRPPSRCATCRCPSRCPPARFHGPRAAHAGAGADVPRDRRAAAGRALSRSSSSRRRLFRAQMRALAGRRLPRGHARPASGGPGTAARPCPQRPVVLSFDDGYRGDYGAAMPILRRRGWPAVLNLLVANLHRRGWGLKTWMVRRMIRNGWEVDSHTLTHPDLDDRLARAAVAARCARSRVVLRRLFHVPVDFFCYPSGAFDAAVIAAVRRAGYLGATTDAARPGAAVAARHAAPRARRRRRAAGRAPARRSRRPEPPAPTARSGHATAVDDLILLGDNLELLPRVRRRRVSHDLPRSAVQHRPRAQRPAAAGGRRRRRRPHRVRRPPLPHRAARALVLPRQLRRLPRASSSRACATPIACSTRRARSTCTSTTARPTT